MNRHDIQNFINSIHFPLSKNHSIEEQLVSERLQRDRGHTPPSLNDRVHNYSSRGLSKTPPLMYSPFMPLGHQPNEGNFGQGHPHLGQPEQKGTNSSFNNGQQPHSYDAPINGSSSARRRLSQESSHDSSDVTPGGSVKNRGRPRGSKSIKTNAHREKTFVCRDCSKSFYTHQNLQQHERIHLGVFPYSCPHCESSYVQRTQLNQHLRTSHNIPLPNEGQIRGEVRNRPFHCQMCPKSFIRKSGLDKHMTKFHAPPIS